MLQHSINLLENSDINKISIIYGNELNKLRASITNPDKYNWIYQKEQLGTGHAVMVAENYFKNMDGYIVVINADNPFLSKQTINNLKKTVIFSDVSLLSGIVKNPTGSGRIIRNNDLFEKIVEEKDANNYEKQINEINVGAYIFNIKILFKYINKLTNNNKSGEYYITDIFEILHNNNINISIVNTIDTNEIFNINTKEQLNYANNLLFNP